MQNTHGEIILPALISIVSRRESPARLIAYTSSAVVNYLDGLETLPPSLQKYSGTLMDRLLSIIDTYSMRDDAKMRAMSALSALAAALGEAKQYSIQAYQSAMSTVWPFVDGDVEAEMRARALDCITIIGRSDALTL